MLITEDIDSFQCCPFNGIHDPITHYFNFNGLPLGTVRVLRDSYFDPSPINALFLILHCIILWRVGIAKRP
jgi:hypothetical protein